MSGVAGRAGQADLKSDQCHPLTPFFKEPLTRYVVAFRPRQVREGWTPSKDLTSSGDRQYRVDKC